MNDYIPANMNIFRWAPNVDSRPMKLPLNYFVHGHLTRLAVTGKTPVPVTHESIVWYVSMPYAVRGILMLISKFRPHLLSREAPYNPIQCFYP